MKINRTLTIPRWFPAGLLAALCLVSWAGPTFALRISQKADTRSGMEELKDALSPRSELSAEAKIYFREVGGADPTGPTVLLLFPPGKKVLERYRKKAGRIVVLKDEKEPSGQINREALRRMVREIDPDYLATFVNDPVDVEMLNALPHLKGITHMGLGTNNFTKEALQAIADRKIRLSYVGRADGEDPVLTGATAETLETLFLVQWFKALERVQFIRPGENVPDSLSWRKIFQRRLLRPREHDLYVLSIADLHWAMLLRQAGKIDEAVQIVKKGGFQGALNGDQGTVRGHQLSSVPEIGLKTTLGFSGEGDFLVRWLSLARAHGVDRILYTGQRALRWEKEFGAEHVGSLDELAQAADYVVRSPDDKAVLSRGVLERLNGQRKYLWLVDSSDWAVPEDLADPQAEIEIVLDSTLAGKRLGFLGLGHIGARVARFMAPFGVWMQSIKHNELNPVYEKLGNSLEEGGLGMQYREQVHSLLSLSDGILAALPGGTEPYLAPANWPDEKLQWRRVWANVGRGSVFGDEQKVADELRQRPDIELALDVLTNESLPLARQPLLAEDLRGRVMVTPHIASNKESPAGVSVRDAMGMVMADNFEAMLDGKRQEELPNPVSLPSAAAGLEEPQQRIERAIGRLSQSTFLPAVVSPKERVLLGDLLQRVPVFPLDGKAIYLEGGAIYLGMSPERDETTLARLLVWGGRVWRATELISEKGRATAAGQPVLSQRLLSAADILRDVRIQLHTSPDTTVYKGKIFLAVGDSTTSPKLALELVRVAGVLSRDPATSSVSPVQKAEELALTFLGETDTAARQQFEAARDEGAAEGEREQANQKPQEPALDADLVTRIKQYLQLGSVSLEETWPVFAEDLSAVLRLTSRDRQTRFLEGLYNVFGLILYSKNTATDVGVRDEQAARLNIASMAAEALAKALGRYLNDPFLGQKGTVSQKEALEETARGMEMENLLSYLRFGHISEFLAQKIKKQEVSPEIAHQLLREKTLARRTSGMTLTMQQTVGGMLTSQTTHTLLLTGPRLEETGSSGDVSREPKPYIPELAPEDGYRIGADGLIDEFLKTLKTGGTLEDLKIPSVLLDNVRLALSRLQERTPSGSDELSDLIRFYHYLGSVERVQKAWRPFLKEADLPVLAKEFQLSERAVVAGLFVWRILQPPFDSDAEKTLLTRLNELGKSTDAIFSFIAEFQKRFKAAQAVRKEVTQAAREAHHAHVVADLLPQQEERRDQERDRLLQRFAELGIPLGGDLRLADPPRGRQRIRAYPMPRPLKVSFIDSIEWFWTMRRFDRLTWTGKRLSRRWRDWSEARRGQRVHSAPVGRRL